MCIFCKIIHNEIPSVKVYEDDNVLAILDISQVTKGHTLVLPKKHCSSILDVDQESMIALATLLPKLSNQIVNSCHALGCNILSNQGEVAGQTVNHLHFHIIPRYSKDDSIHIEFRESPKQDLEKILNIINP